MCISLWHGQATYAHYLPSYCYSDSLVSHAIFMPCCLQLYARTRISCRPALFTFFATSSFVCLPVMHYVFTQTCHHQWTDNAAACCSAYWVTCVPVTWLAAGVATFARYEQDCRHSSWNRSMTTYSSTIYLRIRGRSPSEQLLLRCLSSLPMPAPFNNDHRHRLAVPCRSW